MSNRAATPSHNLWRGGGVYALLLLAAVACFFAVSHFGHELAAPVGTSETPFSVESAQPHSQTLFHVLLALLAVISLGRLLGFACQWISQPPVIGEVLAGICLGPSLLGRLSPAAMEYVLPPTVAPYLQVMAQLGVILYMFVVGLELDVSGLRRRGQAAIAISHASIVLPFTLGSLLALYLYPRLSTSDVPFDAFALFLGVSMSVTAFPVLARILTDRKLHKTPLGVLAITCAAADDATAWCLLALVLGVTRAEVSEAFLVVGLTLGFVLFMFFVAKPLLAKAIARFEPRDAPLSPATLAVVLAGVLLSALATETIGVHAIFGAFLLGAVLPHDSRLAREASQRIEGVTSALLLPAFFAFTGMRTSIGLVSGLEHWLLCGLVVLVATAGKFGGTLAAARVTGLGWRESSALGILMNTRGLMELIVLNIGLDMRVISPTLYAMLVIMALVTTVATTPLLQLMGVASLHFKTIGSVIATTGRRA